MKVLFLLPVCLSLVQVQSDQTNSWGHFQIRNNKIYKNQTERILRQKIFNDNLQIIEEHNKKYEQGLVSYKLGVNQFADLTDEEFAPHFKTVKVNVLQMGEQKDYLSTNEALPQSIDWRSKSVVSEVKNQARCGACWAFTATGAIESHLAIQTGELKSLSEQQLVDCDISNTGCDGGTVQGAINYVTANGLTLQHNYPFQGVQQTCNTSKVNESAAWTWEYINIVRNNETNLKQAVGLKGPVAVGINYLPIKFYQEGIFDGECSDVLNHAVLAVGYGIDDRTGVEYWILKNSWGLQWGDQGYFKLLMGKNLCGLARQACYPVIKVPSKPDSGCSIKAGSFLVLFSYMYILLY